MNRIVRLLGLTAVLLTFFLAAVLASGLRLQSQAGELREKTLEARRGQLAGILALAKPGPLPWSDAFLRSLEKALDARISLAASDAVAGHAASARPRSGEWRFDHPLSTADGQPQAWLRVEMTAPHAVTLVRLYQHTALVLLILAFGFIVVLAIALLLSTRREMAPPTPTETTPPHDFGSLSHLAKVSLQQGADLARERNERLRAEEDAHFQQVLLNRSLEERIQLGRELHDGIIQSLYATGLTLEAAKKQMAKSPPEAAAQLEKGLTTLNGAIRDIRGYILGLAPENLRRQSFADAVASLTHALDGGRNAHYELRIDASAAARLGEEQALNLLQIIREAVSNSLRHGGATQVTIRLHENSGELCLLLQDNGNGFDPGKAGGAGHGLNNLQSRADRLHATLRLTSTPGEGTRIVLTMAGS